MGGRWSTDTDGGAIPTAILWSGAVLLGWSIVEGAGLLVVAPSTALDPRYALGYVTHVPACAGLIRIGRLLRDGDLPATYYGSIASHWLGAGGAFLAFNVGIMLVYPAGDPWLTLSWVRWALSLGLLVGAFIGFSRARTIRKTLAAQRESLRAEHFQQERDLADHMNDILRHEVLNATQAILGNATLLKEREAPIDPDDDRLERIHRQGEELSAIIREIRALLETKGGDRDRWAVDLEATLSSEVRKIRARHPEVMVETDVPADVSVLGDELCGRIFGNLLDNAVEHNRTEGLAIRIGAEVAEDTVVVTVRDTGDGIPAADRASLFERPTGGDHGLGLHIVSELLDSYGGTIELVDTGDHGTTFEVTLPRADVPADGDEGNSEADASPEGDDEADASPGGASTERRPDTGS